MNITCDFCHRPRQPMLQFYRSGALILCAKCKRPGDTPLDFEVYAPSREIPYPRHSEEAKKQIMMVRKYAARPMAGKKRPGPKVDISGKPFGSLTVIDYAGDGLWNCRCSCGRMRQCYAGKLERGEHDCCVQCARKRAAAKSAQTMEAQKAVAA